jgi:hypothetical protein
MESSSDVSCMDNDPNSWSEIVSWHDRERYCARCTTTTPTGRSAAGPTRPRPESAPRAGISGVSSPRISDTSTVRRGRTRLRRDCSQPSRLAILAD